MVSLFLSVYDFFEKYKSIFWVVFITIVVLLAIGTSQIEIEEDITKFFPKDKKVENLNYVFQNSKFAEKLTVMVSMRDSAAAPDPDSLVAMADKLIVRIEDDLKPYVSKITSRVDDGKILGIVNIVRDHLPVFLDDRDYVQLDTLLKPENTRNAIRKNYNQLVSPIGVGTKKIIVQDPLGLSFLALRKLSAIQYDEKFELYDGYILTRDHRHIIFFITPFFPPIETGNNTDFINDLNSIVSRESANHPLLKVSFFGASSVAVGNAVQLRRDTIVTVSLMVILLAAFLIGFFKKKRVPFLIFIPVAFGGLFSLCCIFLIQGSVSILALAAGSVILGIAVNYALHFLAHVKHTHGVRVVIEDLASPMTLGSATTVLAFFCLQFTNAAVLRDVGLFAGFSLIGAAACSLIFLPHFISATLFKEQESENWIERIPFTEWASNKHILWVILLVTPILFYFARQVSFDSDVSKLNFMSDETIESQQRLETINRSSLSTIFVVARGSNKEAALKKNEQITPLLQQLKDSGQINRYSSVATFLISDSLQQKRIQKWNAFWTTEKKLQILSTVQQEVKKLKFSDVVLKNFESLISKEYSAVDAEAMGAIQATFFDDYIIEKDKTVTVVTLVNTDPSSKSIVYELFQKTHTLAFDRQMLANLFVGYVNADFNFIVLFTAILVFISLLISYGRIELTLITFVPMFITWIWILGIMALIGIHFNIVNVMVSTFIFGLGDDYSIFIMDGLQQEYKTGKKNLPAIRASIFLSAVTTIAGLGVLIFARHPAMRSIAAISIIGIVCVFVMSQTIEPYLFRMLISERTQKARPPATLSGFVYTVFTYGLFIFCSILLTFIGLIFRVIPFDKKNIKLIYHSLISGLAWIIIYLQPHIKKKIINRTRETFSQPCVMIANHSSIVDILLTIQLHPKLILVTNKWVWNSSIMGGVVRLADYYPVAEGVEESVNKLHDRVKEGYSVVIFPEGTRSEEGRLRRFHKGAFYLAEVLNLPIQPLLIHGAGYAVPKGTFYLNPGQFTLKLLSPISHQNEDFGVTYAERTKKISRYFKHQYAALASEIETPDYFARRVIANYLYKGPVLEWYLKIKLRLEKNYTTFYDLLPKTGTILDLGCGYGFMCYMLQFRSSDQTIIGVDYDEEKIETARNGYLKSTRLQFHRADILQFPLDNYSGIVLSDVLHYLEPSEQEDLLHRCCSALLPGGVLVIRDGNKDMKKRHRGTQLTEFFSVKVFKFNKSKHTLSFLSANRISQLVELHGLTVEIEDNSRLTSNILMIIRKSEVCQ
jgi:1-acyl-sn-glycerol-3-phosphate acyltransferase